MSDTEPTDNDDSRTGISRRETRRAKALAAWSVTAGVSLVIAVALMYGQKSPPCAGNTTRVSIGVTLTTLGTLMGLAVIAMTLMNSVPRGPERIPRWERSSPVALVARWAAVGLAILMGAAFATYLYGPFELCF